MNEIRDAAQGIDHNVKSLGADHKHGKIDRWLRAPDPSTNYNKALKQRHEDSGRWFLEGLAFANWKTRRNSFLWLYGIPGCGKTILSSTIIQHLESSLPSQPLLYFYFAFAEPDKQSFENMIRSLINQLYYQREDVQERLDTLFSACDNGRRQPSTASLWTTFLQIIQQVGEVWIVLDAVDECHDRTWNLTEGMLSWMMELLGSEERNVHVLMTSRPEQQIDLEVAQWACVDDTVPIEGDDVAEDIRAYIHTRVRQDDGLKRWRSRPDIQDEIEVRLMKEADGM